MGLSESFAPDRPRPLHRIKDKNIKNIWTRKLLQLVTAANANFARTHGGILRAPCPDFYAVRIGIPNVEGTTVNVTAASVAVTNSNADIVTPSVGSGVTQNGATGWCVLKWGGNNSTALAAQATPGDLNNPAVTYSDWLDINSIPPIDAGVNTPYLLFRIKLDAAFTYAANVDDDSVNVNTRALYQSLYRANADGDFVTASTTTMTNGNKTASANTPLYIVEFRSSKGCIRMPVTGNSISKGDHASLVQNGSTRFQMGWWQQANQIFTDRGIEIGGCGINLFQNAIGGRTTALYLAYGKSENAYNPAPVHLFSCFSPNDQPDGNFTQAQFDLMFQRCMNFAAAALENGTTPVFTVLAPNDNYTLSVDTMLLAHIAKIKASGFFVIDLSVVITQPGTSPRKFLTGTQDADGLHPITPGYAIMADEFIRQIIAFLNQSFKI